MSVAAKLSLATERSVVKIIVKEVSYTLTVERMLESQPPAKKA
jgi:hypothetical protein